MDGIYVQAKNLIRELFQAGGSFREVELCIVACSVSKVDGKKVDTVGSAETANEICRAVWESMPDGVRIAVQCCEHINRAVIVENEYAKRYGLDQVMVYPTDSAGGTFAAAAYSYFKDPVIVEAVNADAGIDIGLNMIGMNLKSVAQPILISTEFVGGARTLAARTRYKLIGGERACYRTAGGD